MAYVERSSPRRLGNPSVRKMLDAAEAEFAEKGFDAARIDDVARRAGVNKSHIYYHFDGKEQLLDDLIELRLSEILAEKDELLAGADRVDDVPAERVVRESLTTLLGRHPDFLRLALVESLKRTGRRPPVVRLAHAAMDDAVARLRALGVEPDRGEFAAAFLFLGLLPVVGELLLGDDWAAELGVDPGVEREQFLALFTRLYTGYLAGLPRADGNRGATTETETELS